MLSYSITSEISLHLFSLHNLVVPAKAGAASMKRVLLEGIQSKDKSSWIPVSSTRMTIEITKL